MTFETLNNGESWLIIRNKINNNLTKTVEVVAWKDLSDNNFADADKSKLDAITAGATANSSDAVLLNRANHTWTQTADTIVAWATNDITTIAERTAIINNSVTGKKSINPTVEAWNLTFALSAGDAQFVNRTNNTLEVLTFAWATGLTPTFGAWPVINVVLNSNGSITYEEEWTRADEATKIRLCRLGTPWAWIFDLLPESQNYYDKELTNKQFIEAIAPIVNLEVSNVISAWTWLTINKSAGTLLVMWGNTDIDNPDEVVTGLLTWPTMVGFHRDGSGGSTVTGWVVAFNPNAFDDWDGTLWVVPNNNWTSTRIYLTSANQLLFEYGQATYASEQAAIDWIFTDSYTRLVSRKSVLLGAVIIQEGAAAVSSVRLADELWKLWTGWATGSATTAWGSLTGTLSNQADLNAELGNKVDVTTAAQISTVTEKVSPIGADFILIEDSADSNNKKRIQVGNLPTAWGWETNTASNVWTWGESLVDWKVGVDLQFKSINSTSNKLAVADDVANKRLNLTVNENNIVHQNLSWAWTNTHAQIDTHITNTANNATATLTNKTIDFNSNTITNLPAWSSNSTQSSVIAWEDVNTWDAISYQELVPFLNIPWDGLLTNTKNLIGRTVFQMQRQTITIAGTITNPVIEIPLETNWTPTDNLEIAIYRTSDDVLITDVVVKDMATIPDGYIDYSFALTGSLTLTTDQAYYIRVNRSGTLSDTDYANWEATANGVDTEYTGGTSAYWNGSSWVANNVDHVFNITSEDRPAWYYKANASDSNKSNFIWFANETVTSGNTVNINTSWIDVNQTTLTLGDEYYLSNTPWAIEVTPWTNSVKVGKAISATELEIHTNNQNSLNWETTTVATTWAVVLGNAEGYITIKINWVDKKIPYYWI